MNIHHLVLFPVVVLCHDIVRNKSVKMINLIAQQRILKKSVYNYIEKHTQAVYAIAIWNLVWFLYNTKSHMHKSAQIVTACQ